MYPNLPQHFISSMEQQSILTQLSMPLSSNTHAFPSAVCGGKAVSVSTHDQPYIPRAVIHHCPFKGVIFNTTPNDWSKRYEFEIDKLYDGDEMHKISPSLKLVLRLSIDKTVSTTLSDPGTKMLYSLKKFSGEERRDSHGKAFIPFDIGEIWNYK